MADDKSSLLFSRAQHNSSTDEVEDMESVWDDTLLIQAYERAVNLAKSNLKKNISGNLESKSPSLPAKVDKVSDSLKEPKTKGRELNSPPKDGWRLGSKCRAVWSHDGVEYEATVVCLRTNKNQARVKFVGYNNEENVKLSSLKPSLGDAARQRQLSESQVEGEENNSFSAPLENNSLPMEESMMLPPPPPPHVISYLPRDEQEALSAMLMSWYMSGYHTGYYQGLIAAKASPNKKK